MKYSGTYFDYGTHKFKKNVKFFSTPGGNTVFLSLMGVDPSELWTHARKVHVFFPQMEFMTETQLFYSGYLKYLRMLQEKNIIDPPVRFYLHFMIGNRSEEYGTSQYGTPVSERQAFYEYLLSATKAYSVWRDTFLPQEGITSNGPRLTIVPHINPSDMVKVVHDRYKEVRFTMKNNGLVSFVYFILNPSYLDGVWDLVVEMNSDRITPRRFSLSENMASDMSLIFQKKKRSGRSDLTPEQLFALSTIKAYCDPALLDDILETNDMGELLKFIMKQGRYEDLPLDSIGCKMQKSLSQAYDCFITSYRLMTDEEKLIAGGNENE